MSLSKYETTLDEDEEARQRRSKDIVSQPSTRAVIAKRDCATRWAKTAAAILAHNIHYSLLAKKQRLPNLSTDLGGKP